MNTDLPFEQVSGYRLVRPIGAGGMGEVYLARDPRLEREVAIKLLPPELSRDPEALGRFRQEALTLAALSHPNIAAIYGFEQTPDGGLALVLEYIEGESLATRLERGALPMTEALTVCAQVAEALEVAHERGIVHRDLKPGNVMLAPRGLVKVLDFGLAKRTGGLQGLPPGGPPVALRGAPSPSPATGGRPASMPVAGVSTVAGAWIGTPGYMSPEQLVNGVQDQRGDVFAFGAVLYECLAGRRAFEGGDVWEIMARVLHETPDPAALPERLPPRVRSLIDRCLDKQVESRLGDLHTVRVEIEEVLGVRRAAALRAGERTEAPHNLPRQLTRFIGRRAELDRCREDLGRARLLTLLGMGGSGKTRLALELAETARNEFPDGVWFADLGALNDPERVIEVVAAVVGARVEPGRPLEPTLVEHIGDRRVLLLLDNCEGVLGGCRMLATRLLTACGQLVIIATTRESLAMPGEVVHVVPPLTLPGGAPDEDPMAAESVQLFVARAEATGSGFTLTPERAAVVAEICRHLDGIPLAIELAAARVRVLAVEQIQARLGDRFRLLTAARGGDQRHATLRAVIEWSTDQLAADERALFAALSVFVGAWSLESAAAVCADHGDEFEILDILQRLVDRSLVVPVRDPAGDVRYRYLESVRQLASELAAASGGTERLRDRHLARFLVLAEEADARFSGTGQKDLLLDLDRDHDDILAAHAWALERGRAEDGLRLSAATHRYWSARGMYRLGRRTLTASLAAASEAPPGAAWATANVRAAAFALYDDDHAAARPLLEQSLAVYRRLGDERGVARALHGLATVALFQCDYPAARRLIIEVLELLRRGGDPGAIASALHNLAVACVALGDLAAGREHYGEALALFRTSGDDLRAAHALEGLGQVHTRAGDHAAARIALATGLRIAADLGAQREIAVGLENAAELAVASGSPGPALAWLGAAAQLREQKGPAMLATEREDQARLIAGVTPGLGGEAAVAVALASGRATPLEQVVESALAWMDEGPGAAPESARARFETEG